MARGENLQHTRRDFVKFLLFAPFSQRKTDTSVNEPSFATLDSYLESIKQNQAENRVIVQSEDFLTKFRGGLFLKALKSLILLLNHIIFQCYKELILYRTTFFSCAPSNSVR